MTLRLEGHVIMKNVIAISRQLGSGGSYIGHRVASKLGMKFLDREILRKVSETLGLEEKELEGREERLLSFWDELLRSMALGTPEVGWVPPSLHAYLTDPELFQAQADVMRHMCTESDCVVMGRGAGHVLRGHARLMTVYLHGSVKSRVERLCKAYPDMTAGEAEEAIHKSDKQRRRFVERLCGYDWAKVEAYDISLSTDAFTLDDAADFVIEAFKKSQVQENS